MTAFNRWLIWTHRYVGIPVSVLFVLWFASGIVMRYTGGMPLLTPQERLDGLAPLDLSQVRLTPAEAAAGAGIRAAPGRAALLTVLGRPAYRFDGATVFGDTGRLLGPVGIQLPVIRVRFADPLETWVYIDPADLRVAGSVHRYSRLERWLFNGLHSLDFAFWYDRRPLWDIGLIALSLGGLASSGIGLWVAPDGSPVQSAAGGAQRRRRTIEAAPRRAVALCPSVGR